MCEIHSAEGKAEVNGCSKGAGVKGRGIRTAKCLDICFAALHIINSSAWHP